MKGNDMQIAKRKRTVRWIDGFPVVRVGGQDRIVRNMLQKVTDNPKTLKNESEVFTPYGVVMSPEKSAGIGNMCAFAGHCVEMCLDHQGRGAARGDMGLNVHGIRIARTIVFQKERQWALDTLAREVEAAVKREEQRGKRVCIRPNMFTDYPWESTGIIDAFPGVQWYDYTKDPRRVGSVRPNYWVTFSRDSSKDDALCADLVGQGKNVAVVFDDGRTTGGRNLHGPGAPLPLSWNGLPVHPGDLTDARWEDPRGVIVGLVLKAHSADERMKALASGFAVKDHLDE